MTAILLVVGIIVFLGLAGLGLIALFDRRISLALFLLSPAIGMGLVLPVELSLNRLGLPVETFGLWLVLAVALLAAAVVAIRRPQIAWGELRELLPAYAAGTLLAGAPLLIYGLHWVGNGNADMGVYVSSASNFLHHGFFDVPSLSQLVRGLDTGQNMWFWEVVPPNRYGTDALLALASAAAKVDVYQIYMVCSVAAFIALMMATSALCANPEMRRFLLITTVLVALAAPLLLYTVYQQILPQLLGQVAMVAIVALLQVQNEGRGFFWQRSIALGCLATLLMLVYPEITPALLTGLAVTIPFVVWRHRSTAMSWVISGARSIAAAAAALLILANTQLFTFVASARILTAIVGGSAAAVGAGSAGTINYYLVPSGVANLWGLVPFDSYPEPWVSIAIVIGAVAFVVAGVWAIRRLVETGKPLYGMAIVLQLTMVLLVTRESAYVAFKTAFVVQPFLVVIVAEMIYRWTDRAKEKWNVRPFVSQAAFVAIIVALTSYTTFTYLGATADAFVHKSAQFTELHAASQNDLYGELEGIARQYAGQPQRQITIDGLFGQVSVLAGIALRGHPLLYEGVDPFPRMYGGVPLKIRNIWGWPKGVRKLAEARAFTRKGIFSQRLVLIEGRPKHLYVPPLALFQQLGVARNADPPDSLFLETGPSLSLLNRSAANALFDVRAEPWHSVKNWLCFVESDYGSPPEYRLTSALGGLEPDPFNSDDYMETVGKSMLLEVINSSPTIDLRLALTATLNPRPYNDLPTITVVGANRVTIRGLGSGSARFVTPPIRPLEMNGRKYIIVYFGNRLVKYKYQRSWLMSLYGRSVDLDPRLFALHARDISVNGSNPIAPSVLTRFPQDLMNPGLLYSGIFEDGWLGPTFKVRLRSNSVQDTFWLRVNVPPLSKPQSVSVTIDGRIYGWFSAKPSTYAQLSFPSPGPGVHTIELRSGKIGKILEHDTRPAWGRLMEIGFEPPRTGGS